MALIFSFSAQNDKISSKQSGTVIKKIAEVVVKDYDKLPETEKNEIIEAYQFLVRKAAHFSIYAVLGTFSFLTLVTYNKYKIRLRIIMSAAICLLYSITDEIHQIFISGRSGQIRDVCIDFAGSLSAILILALLARTIKRIYRIIRTV